MNMLDSRFLMSELILPFRKLLKLKLQLYVPLNARKPSWMLILNIRLGRHLVAETFKLGFIKD